MRAFVALLTCIACVASHAQNVSRDKSASVEAYPTRNIRLIVPFTAGSGPDAMGRMRWAASLRPV